MSKLSGKNSLTIKNAPENKNTDHLGLIEGHDYQTKSFRLSTGVVEILEEITEQFSKEANFKIAMGKVVELAVFQLQGKTLRELLKD